MEPLLDGQTTQVPGSSGSVYELKNVGGVFSCSCPAWRNQSQPPHQRTCKHLRALRGEPAESQRLQASGASLPQSPKRPSEGAGPPAPPLLLAHTWDQRTDLTGWWMSEKLDGVRAYWDGRRLLSRLGNPFVTPDWFLEGMPDHPLDGELWAGRKMFQRTVSIVRRQDRSPEWRHIRYVVFDAPQQPLPFEGRLEHVRRWMSGAPGHCQILDHFPCESPGHLRSELSRVETAGGEGLMMRQPGSAYEIGRSWTLLKIKSFLDAEATVIGHQAGVGKHAGRLGALLLQLADGTRFSVGTGFRDAERQSPPPIGGVVTFRYQELSQAGVPRFPTYVGVRFDAPHQRMEDPMKVIKVGLTEACDLHSQSAQERLGALLHALCTYAGGSDQALRDYAEQYPYSRVKEALDSSGASATPAAPRATAPKAPTAPQSSSPPVEGEYRRFEFAQGSSSKFWEIAVDGSQQTVRFGRIGTAGQTKTKTFASEAQAERDTEKLIAEKLGKGYREVGG